MDGRTDERVIEWMGERMKQRLTERNKRKTLRADSIFDGQGHYFQFLWKLQTALQLQTKHLKGFIHYCTCQFTLALIQPQHSIFILSLFFTRPMSFSSMTATLHFNKLQTIGFLVSHTTTLEQEWPPRVPCSYFWWDQPLLWFSLQQSIRIWNGLDLQNKTWNWI